MRERLEPSRKETEHEKKRKKRSGEKDFTLSLPEWLKSKIRFENAQKQTALRESTVEKISFEWSHNRNLSTDSKVRINLQNSITHFPS